jgi:hypothetical protein
LSGNYAFVADYTKGLRVIDITDPAKPFEAGFIKGNWSSWGIDVSGHYAYMANGSFGFRIIDISDPVKPVETGLFDQTWYAFDVHAFGNYAYLADGPGGLRILDISDPAKPIEAGLYQTGQLALGVTVHDNLVFLADHDDGLYIIRNDLITGIGGQSDPLASAVVLEGNFPNPFSTETTIHYSLPVSGRVRLTVFDLMGREVHTLVYQPQATGN